MKRYIALWTALLLWCLAGAGVLLADKKKDPDAKTRIVEGGVTDSAEAPLDGAVVQLKDTKTLQVRSFITKSDGRYRFNGLNPNTDYELKADYRSKSTSTRTLSSFDTRKIAIINFKVDVAAAGGTPGK